MYRSEPLPVEVDLGWARLSRAVTMPMLVRERAA